MVKRVHAPSEASLAPGQAKDAKLTRAIEECEQLYSRLKFAAHTQGIPAARDKNLFAARDHIVKIIELIGTGE